MNKLRIFLITLFLAACAALGMGPAAIAAVNAPPPDPGLGRVTICNQTNSTGNVYWSNNGTANKYTLAKGACTGPTAYSVTTFAGWCSQFYQTSYPMFLDRGTKVDVLYQGQAGLKYTIRTYIC